jgi:hypothetical protein
MQNLGDGHRTFEALCGAQKGFVPARCKFTTHLSLREQFFHRPSTSTAIEINISPYKNLLDNDLATAGISKRELQEKCSDLKEVVLPYRKNAKACKIFGTPLYKFDGIWAIHWENRERVLLYQDADNNDLFYIFRYFWYNTR